MGRTQRRGAGAREQRRKEGKERNAAWRELDATAKIAILDSRPGSSARQIARLMKAAG